MSRSRQKSPRKTKVFSPSLPPETPTADAVTVAWLVSCLFTLVGDIILMLLGTVLAAQFRDERLLALAKLALLATALFAVTTLPLTYAVLRVRCTAPPRGILLLAVAGSLVPLIVLALTVVRSGI